MLELLSDISDADIGKLSTYDCGTDSLKVSDLPVRPDYCFIDGEHTKEAALQDARLSYTQKLWMRLRRKAAYLPG
jgi:hypothetical protein